MRPGNVQELLGCPPYSGLHTLAQRHMRGGQNVVTTGPIETGPAYGRIGPYRLVEKLGEGGMGVVYCGLDERGRGFAVKVLRDHIAYDPQARARLEREVNVLTLVEHPRVAPLIGADIQGPRPYLATRLVSGGPLDAWIERRGPAHGESLHRAARDLMDALEAIHAAGVVHRDLKPGNVLMPDGRPVVIDFGIAHAADEVRLTSTGFVMGTPGYIAPELLDGGTASAATDWWGFGATLAFMATGRAPFGGGPTAAVLDRVRRGQADLDGVEPAMAGLLRRALDPDPAARPSAAEIEAALANAEEAAAGANTQIVPQVDAAATGFAAALTARIPAVRRTPRRENTGAAMHHSADAGTRADDGADIQTRDPDPATMVQPRIATRTMPVVPSAPAREASRYAGFAAPPAGYRRAERAPANAYGGPTAGPAPGYLGNGTPFALQIDTPPAVAPPAVYRASRSGTLAALGILCIVAAAIAPVLVAVLGLTWSTVARFVQRCVDSLYVRRAERGPRRRDVASITALSPFYVIAAVAGASFAALLPALVAVAGYFGAAAIMGEPGLGPVGRAVALMGGAAAALVVSWWGPGGKSLRRGSRRMVRAVTPGRFGPATVAGLALSAAVIFGLITQSSGYAPTGWPLSEGFSWRDLLPSFGLPL